MKSKLRFDEEILAELDAYVQMLTLNPEVPKPTKAFIGQALYGMLQSQSVVLSRIAQALDEPTELLYRVQRLSYQLANDRWDPLSAASSYLDWAAEQIKADTVISVDMGDIAKKFARKMPGLGIIWDGSAKKTAKGYPLVEVEAIQPNGRHMPLYLDLLSTRKAAYVSQNQQIDLAIDLLVSHIGAQGIWVFDRGNDDQKRFKFLDQRNLQWVIRARGDRHVERADAPFLKPKAIAHWAKQVEATFELRVKNNGKLMVLKAGFLPIRLPDQPDVIYYLVVVWTKRKKPWYLMTNLSTKEVSKAVFAYVRRWGVEDAARVIKQAFDLENIRLLTFQGLRKMVWLAAWAYGFLCIVARWPKNLLSGLLALVPALWDWGELKIVHYRVADALAALLNSSPPPSNARRFSSGAVFA